ncbi:hypothetical protein HYH03_017374 [Edaphochlamys debaryana]|uniref:Uncharacterized protein n=1 Tax=Edaphochlamys debaryana TaxID=47281 RepID=A0A836BQN3_9CHLO|nr:hypothetical protein HYH03_017374 [Edaphochlamys debaryana]|eukprot:KAG2483778.1 hypothetical protein HYH03_017374 [Edaphochlamys debaryana]
MAQANAISPLPSVPGASWGDGGDTWGHPQYPPPYPYAWPWLPPYYPPRYGIDASPYPPPHPPYRHTWTGGWSGGRPYGPHSPTLPLPYAPPGPPPVHPYSRYPPRTGVLRPWPPHVPSPPMPYEASPTGLGAALQTAPVSGPSPFAPAAAAVAAERRRAGAHSGSASPAVPRINLDGSTCALPYKRRRLHSEGGVGAGGGGSLGPLLRAPALPAAGLGASYAAAAPEATPPPEVKSEPTPLPKPVRVTVTGAAGEAPADGPRHSSRRRRRGGSGDSDEENDREGDEDGRRSLAEAAMVGGRVVGVFHLAPYLEGGRCIELGGAMLTRSAFERVGGSSMAKWYRSIKVLPEGCTLGRWLTRHGLPVLKGVSRNRKAKWAAQQGAEGSTGEEA